MHFCQNLFSLINSLSQSEIFQFLKLYFLPNTNNMKMRHSGTSSLAIINIRKFEDLQR